MLTISCNILNTVLKVKNKRLSGYRMVVKFLVVYSHDCRAAQHHERASYHIPLAQGKDHNSKTQAWFLLNAYHFHTIVCENH